MNGMLIMDAIRQVATWLDGSIFDTPVAGGGVALLLAVALVALAHLLAARRTREIVTALEAGMRGHLRAHEAQRVAHFAVAFDPPPDPFTRLDIAFTMGRGGPMAALTWLFTRRQALHLSAALPMPPAARLVWDAAAPTARATGRGPETELWVSHRLVYGPGEYAVQGDNTAALEHAFAELQARFGPFLRSVTVQEASPHIIMQLDVARLNREDLPALVNALRALGRAARI